MHASGFNNTVASLGTSFTEEHARFLSKYAQKVFILFDLDEAGKRATDRTIPLVFKWGMIPYIVNIKSAKDPAELYESGKMSELSMAIGDAKDFVEFYLDGIKSDEDKIEALRKLKNIIELSRDEVLKGVFTSRVKEISGVDLKILYKKKVGKKKKEYLNAELKTVIAALQFKSLTDFIRNEFEDTIFIDKESRALVEEIKKGKSFNEILPLLDENKVKRYVEFLEALDLGAESRNLLEKDLLKKLKKLKRERLMNKSRSLSEIVKIKKEEMGENEGLDNPK